MAERTIITEATQIGVEATSGTAVAASRRLRTVGFNLDPEFESRQFRPSGNKYPAINSPGKEWVGGDVEGAGDYNELIYPISGLLGPATITTPTGGATSRQHLWNIAPAAAQDPKSFTVEKGSTVRAERSVYVILNSLGLTFNRDEITLEGDLIGRRLEDGVALTASPTTVALSPILPQHISVYFDTTFAGLGTTKLTRVVEAGFNVGDRFGTLWPLDAAQDSYVAVYEGEPSSEVTLHQVADAAGMAHLPRARAGTTGYLRIGAVGPIIEGAIPYSLQIDVPVKVTDYGYGDADGLKTAEWTFGLFDDASQGSAGTIRLVNILTAL